MFQEFCQTDQTGLKISTLDFTMGKAILFQFLLLWKHTFIKKSKVRLCYGVFVTRVDRQFWKLFILQGLVTYLLLLLRLMVYLIKQSIHCVKLYYDYFLDYNLIVNRKTFEEYVDIRINQALDLLKAPGFNINRPTVFYAHGFIETAQQESVQVLPTFVLFSYVMDKSQ